MYFILKKQSIISITYKMCPHFGISFSNTVKWVVHSCKKNTTKKHNCVGQGGLKIKKNKMYLLWSSASSHQWGHSWPLVFRCSVMWDKHDVISREHQGRWNRAGFKRRENLFFSRFNPSLTSSIFFFIFFFYKNGHLLILYGMTLGKSEHIEHSILLVKIHIPKDYFSLGEDTE